MFIYTMKFTKKKAVIFLILLGLFLCAIIAIAGHIDRAKELAAGSYPAAETNEQRIKYLSAYGWEVEPEPVQEQEVLIPKEFSDVYTEYNALQLSQGFDLTDYAGLEAVRYTYIVTNYPDYSGKVFADILVRKGMVIAGDIQSAALDGFMHGFKMPTT